MNSLKPKFKELHSKRVPTGDPLCPPAVCHANQLKKAIIDKIDGSYRNSEKGDGGKDTISSPHCGSEDEESPRSSDGDDGMFEGGDVEFDCRASAEEGGRWLHV